MRVLRLIASLIVTGLALACGAAWAQAGDEGFHEARLREGVLLYENGQFEEAAARFRVARFGFLARTDLLLESLAREALAEEATGRHPDAVTTLERFVDVQRRFGSYREEKLGGLADDFARLIERSLPGESLASLSKARVPPSPPTQAAALAPTATATPLPPTRTQTATRTPRPATSTRTPTPTPTPPPPTETPSPRPTRTASPTRTSPPTLTPVPPTRTPIPTWTPLRASPTPLTPSRTLIRTGPYVPPEQVDRPPRIRQAANPVYPPAALASRIRGLVVLRVLVSDAGFPIEIRVVQGARAGLTQAAVDAVRRWTFVPGLDDGSPVTTWTTVRIPFEAVPFGPNTRFGEAPPQREAVTPVPTKTATPVPTPRRRAETAPVLETPGPVPPREPVAREAVEPEAVYRTRSAALFAVSPEQARVFVDGRYIGVADDWDGRGGGLEFRFEGRGGHLVRFELPGYRDLTIEVVMTAAAEADTAEVDEELERISRDPYRRLPSVAARTSGPVELSVQPPDATVSERGRTLGRADSFTRSNPLNLSGPETHDLVLSAPGYEPKMVRVLVAPYLGVASARVEASLKRVAR